MLLLPPTPHLYHYVVLPATPHPTIHTSPTIRPSCPPEARTDVVSQRLRTPLHLRHHRIHVLAGGAVPPPQQGQQAQQLQLHKGRGGAVVLVRAPQLALRRLRDREGWWVWNQSGGLLTTPPQGGTHSPVCCLCIFGQSLPAYHTTASHHSSIYAHHATDTSTSIQPSPSTCQSIPPPHPTQPGPQPRLYSQLPA